MSNSRLAAIDIGSNTVHMITRKALSVGRWNHLSARPKRLVSARHWLAPPLRCEAINYGISSGDDPATAASVVVKAIRGEPRLLYQAGREAKMLDRLEKWAPSKLLDKGLRKHFGLSASPEGHSLATIQP